MPNEIPPVLNDIMINQNNETIVKYYQNYIVNNEVKKILILGTHNNLVELANSSTVSF
jgi:hypothetical protein